MSKAFKVHAEFKPAGDQPKAIEQLVSGLEDGLRASPRITTTPFSKSAALIR